MVSVYRIYLLASDNGVEPMVSGLKEHPTTSLSANKQLTVEKTEKHRRNHLSQCSRSDAERPLQQPADVASPLLLLALSKGLCRRSRRICLTYPGRWPVVSKPPQVYNTERRQWVAVRDHCKLPCSTLNNSNPRRKASSSFQTS